MSSRTKSFSATYDLIASVYFLRYDRNKSIHCVPDTKPKTKYDELPCYRFPTARMEKRQIWAKFWCGFIFFLWSLYAFAGIMDVCHIRCPDGPKVPTSSCPEKKDLFGWTQAYNTSLPPGADIWESCDDISSQYSTHFNYESQNWSWVDNDNRTFPLDICYVPRSFTS